MTKETRLQNIITFTSINARMRAPSLGVSDCACLPLQPKALCSPTSVLQSQRATCFEYAALLCSLLLGEDYDAYCVSGYAVKEMCLLDQSLQQCPLLDPEVKVSACSVHMRSTIRLSTARCESDFLVVCLRAGCAGCEPRTEGPG